ncbi:hypothetical protein AB0922_26640 [Actinacidiphila alni]
MLSCAVRLLDLGFFRAGSAGYTRDNGAYGPTTMLREHAEYRCGEVRFSHPAKGAEHMVRAVAEGQTCAAVRALLRRAGGGEELLAYGEGRARYTRGQRGAQRMPAGLLGRRHHGQGLLDVARHGAGRGRAGGVLARGRHVAKRTPQGGGPRRSGGQPLPGQYIGRLPAPYIDPRVIEIFEEGRTVAADLDRLGEGTDFGRPAAQGAVERAVLALLRDGAEG